MSTTLNLLLPRILAGQAQKHVNHNEALRTLDGLVQLSVRERTRNAPPVSPTNGARYIVGPASTGACVGWAGGGGMGAARGRGPCSTLALSLGVLDGARDAGGARQRAQRQRVRHRARYPGPDDLPRSHDDGRHVHHRSGVLQLRDSSGAGEVRGGAGRGGMEYQSVWRALRRGGCGNLNSRDKWVFGASAA